MKTMMGPSFSERGSPKKVGFVAFALGLACLGCCLPPLMGAFATVGGIAVLGRILHSQSFWIILAIGSIALGAYLFRKPDQGKCCPGPAGECGSGSCNTSIGNGPDRGAAK